MRRAALGMNRHKLQPTMAMRASGRAAAVMLALWMLALWMLALWMLALWMLALWVVPAYAVVIELKDVASDRVERQRAEAIGQLPLAGTPNISQLGERLAAKKMAMGNHMLIRVFKSSSELEVWMRTGNRYELFATYPICNWSGTLGPKMTEGDKQSPEGVYTVTSRQLHLIGRHPRSLNLGFPNALDRQMSRTGSYILIHGGCGSVGCFAMTNPVIEEVFSLASAALNKGGQDAVQVHVFPFRMTEDRLKAYSMNEWYDFWRNLKDVSDSFERTRQPPRVTVCEGRYWVEDGTSAEEVAAQGPLAVCAVSLAEAASRSAPDDASQVTDPAVGSPVGLPWWPRLAMLPPSSVPSRPGAPMVHSPRERLPIVPSSVQSSEPRLQLSLKNPAVPSSALQAPQKIATTTTDPRVKQPFGGLVQSSKMVDLAPKMQCNWSLASCRQWVANQRSIMLARFAAERVQALKRIAASRR
jgi:murein L,D-transpeptidase YafK